MMMTSNMTRPYRTATIRESHRRTALLGAVGRMPWGDGATDIDPPRARAIVLEKPYPLFDLTPRQTPSAGVYRSPQRFTFHLVTAQIQAALPPDYNLKRFKEYGTLRLVFNSIIARLLARHSPRNPVRELLVGTALKFWIFPPRSRQI